MLDSLLACINRSGSESVFVEPQSGATERLGGIENVFLDLGVGPGIALLDLGLSFLQVERRREVSCVGRETNMAEHDQPKQGARDEFHFPFHYISPLSVRRWIFKKCDVHCTVIAAPLHSSQLRNYGAPCQPRRS